jgi:hypothetical protein
MRFEYRNVNFGLNGKQQIFASDAQEIGIYSSSNHLVTRVFFIS